LGTANQKPIKMVQYSDRLRPTAYGGWKDGQPAKKSINPVLKIQEGEAYGTHGSNIIMAIVVRFCGISQYYARTL